MKKVVFLGLSLAMSIYGFGQTVWVFDPAHSNIQFEVSHMTVSSVTGNFTSFSGTVAADGENFDGADVDVTISTASINTNNLERDKHLREDDFFNAKKFPNIHFVSDSFEMQDNGEFVLSGKLTIRDITHPIRMTGKFGGIISINKQKKAGFSAKGKLDRFDYGLKWDDSLDNGGLIVGEDVDITLNIELVKQ